MTLKEDLESLGFTKKGIISIKQDKNEPDFKLSDETLSETLEGNVYLWVVEIDELPKQVLYIGKAGKTIAKRCSQHIGGFRGGSKKGIKNSVELLKLLNEGTQIGIYGRHSDKILIFEQEVSLCEAEEKALIIRYKGKYKLYNKI